MSELLSPITTTTVSPPVIVSKRVIPTSGTRLPVTSLAAPLQSRITESGLPQQPETETTEVIEKQEIITRMLVTEKKGLKILAVTWNSEGKSICSSSLTGAGCELVWFWNEFIAKVAEANPDIIAFTTQNYASSSLFHAEMLNTELRNMNYDNINNYSMGCSGIGSTKSIVISIFKRNGLENTYVSKNCTFYCDDHKERGAIVAYLQHHNHNIAIISCYFWFSLEAYNNAKRLNDPMIYNSAIQRLNLCLNNVIFKFVKNNGVAVSNVVIFGNLNYRFYSENYDPLQQAIGCKYVYMLSEKELYTTPSCSTFDTMGFDNKCGRILYCRMDNGYQIACTEYDVFHGADNHSFSNRPVYGIVVLNN